MTQRGQVRKLPLAAAKLLQRGEKSLCLFDLREFRRRREAFQRGRQSARAKRRDHKHGEVTTTAAPEIERPDGLLRSLPVTRNMLEGLPNGPRHSAKVSAVDLCGRTQRSNYQSRAETARSDETLEPPGDFAATGKQVSF
jgi:hypothetical protein